MTAARQPSRFKRSFASLRFRLTLSYFVFFGLTLLALGVFFHQTIRSVYDEQLHNILSEEWGAVRGYLRIEPPKRRQTKVVVDWYYDRNDPEEAIIVDRLRQLYILADADGNVLERGDQYQRVANETPESIRAAIRKREAGFHVRHDAQGNAYLIRSGILVENRRPYYFAIGRSYAERERLSEEFTWYYAAMAPLAICFGAVLGWFVSGRALSPVNEVARAAQQITSSDLTVQIPPRGTGDELDRLIEAFNHMIERLDQSFRQTRQFSTDVSHELRTPLTAIRGQLEVAMLAATTPEQYRDAIVNALQDVERLSQTIRALLLLSQAESGQLALQKQPIDLTAAARDFVEQFQIPAESAGIHLEGPASGPLVIEGDPIQIHRLISNLVSNAVKYTPRGGSVQVTTLRHGHEAELTVSDTGVGIPEKHLPYIFDRFYRISASEQRAAGSADPTERGLGLGLSFVAWIVKAHGGRISVTSRPGEGTTFTVLLPVTVTSR
ncbi:MAG TPA: heavy metal sensor histidine kinase [Bryobacteraceae bacterium]|nr:heavy metal sensor histidine kinase [Bryobacteraceae bacterium]